MLSMWLTCPARLKITSRPRTRTFIVVPWRTSAMLTRSAVLDAVDVEEVAAVVGDQRVDEQDVGAEVDELARQVAADEPEAAGDHHAAAAVELAVRSADMSCRRSVASARPCACSPPDDQRDPQLDDVDRGPEQPAEVEELRLAVGAMVVVHRHFGDAEAGVGDLLHHLEADDAAVLLEREPCRRSSGASAGSRSRRRAPSGRRGS